MIVLLCSENSFYNQALNWDVASNLPLLHPVPETEEREVQEAVTLPAFAGEAPAGELQAVSAPFAPPKWPQGVRKRAKDRKNPGHRVI
ncbi:hypothetical protein UY3_10974 [Chelonia mydas]|uniref:Uncharacterized protein n=1 Tax=Chelonia mydas TaxID=8469 RepID=M7B205_CHEMY|nr:hypothetical protein UY3_10974 [Chelonia mydas]